jgi:hypothetical protein
VGAKNQEWAKVFYRQREAEIARFADPDFDWFNPFGRCVWWYRRGVELTLAMYNYHP